MKIYPKHENDNALRLNQCRYSLEEHYHYNLNKKVMSKISPDFKQIGALIILLYVL